MQPQALTGAHPCPAAAGAAKLSPGRLVARGVQTSGESFKAAPNILKRFQYAEY